MDKKLNEFYTKKDIYEIAQYLNIKTLSANWSGIDAVMPIIEKIKDDKAVIIIEFNGTTNDFYHLTIMNNLHKFCVQIKTQNLDNGLCYIIGEYAKEIWSDVITKISSS